MKISKASEGCPGWFSNEIEDNQEVKNNFISPQKASDLLKTNITDEKIVTERDEIERCAREGRTYTYNQAWGEEAKSQLREYAKVCSLDDDKFKAVSEKQLREISEVEAEQEQAMEDKRGSLKLNDPFGIDKDFSIEKEDWEKISTAKKIKSKEDMQAGVVPVRDHMRIDINQDVKTARGKNTILDPDAIKNYAEKGEDTGERLRKEKAEKELAKKQQHEKWEKQQVSKLNKNKSILSRKVFPTEVLNAHSGVKDEVYDFDKFPEKTEGERLKELNVQRRESIRGKEKEKHSFSMEASPKLSVSDDFTAELRKHLKK